MKRLWLTLVIVAAAVGTVAGAEPLTPQALVGTWEGEIQRARARTSNDRTMVIDSVTPRDGTIVARGRYGITGEKMGPMQGTVEMDAGTPVLRFATGAGSTVVLRLHDERHLIGTIDFRGSGQAMQDIPMRLRRVK